MTYLLDVNALVALGFLQHEFHGRVASWVRKLALRGVPEPASCSITELGFVRILVQAPQYGFSIAHTRSVLLQLKSGNTLKLAFTTDITMSRTSPLGSNQQRWTHKSRERT